MRPTPTTWFSRIPLMAVPQFAVASAIAIFVLLIPLPAHWRGRNVALLVLILCVIIQNLFQLVNTIVWAHNVRDVAPVWCDLCPFFLLPKRMKIDADECFFSHELLIVLSTCCRRCCILCLQTARICLVIALHQGRKASSSMGRDCDLLFSSIDQHPNPYVWRTGHYQDLPNLEFCVCRICCVTSPVYDFRRVRLCLLRFRLQSLRRPHFRATAATLPREFGLCE